MVFTGTLDKCKACDKTVYVVDMVTADGVLYHKTCFKCSHCNGRLMTGRFSSLDGVLYCMPHFEQHFKKNGTYSNNKSQSSAKRELSKSSSKLSSMFSGTQDKCATCKKIAYPLEKIVVEGENYHKSCFRCAKGGCFLSASNYAALDGYLYCKPHFAQLFKEKGSYNYLKNSISMKKNNFAPPSLEENKQHTTSELEVAQGKEKESSQEE
ncbi:LIM domain-containing protein WLIM2b-like [Chenopodium quinoa]|uniref:LIM domain-containing protein WLIM2b-like n=1 Tax=Chenopodium quinoa TaxID=63459 RepID=UPI000B77EDB2|nr:LIM domain-containing protein WLIM2b-like [Chenopodium quinoa]